MTPGRSVSGIRAGLVLGVALAFNVSCGGGGDGVTSASGSGSASLAGNWTYRQQAPASCPLPRAHQIVTFPATIAAQGGNVYVMTLSGTDGGSSYSFFYGSGGGYRGNILYSRTTSEFVVFSMSEAPFTLSGKTLSSTASGEYQYVGATLVDCAGQFTITLSR